MFYTCPGLAIVPTPRQIFFGMLLVALTFLCGLAEAYAAETAERRVALVIGNSSYRAAPALPNPAARSPS